MINSNIAMVGGGIFNSERAVNIRSDSTIKGNTVTNRGTVDFGVSNLIQGNQANPVPGSGGGIYNDAGTIGGAARNYGSDNTPENCVGAGCP
jgi:hypothetical protein